MNRTPIGIVEGFYGRAWDQAARLEIIRHFADLGLNFFMYAPKSDRSLRRDWRRPFLPVESERLRDLALACRLSGLSFGVGLSPFEFWRSNDASDLGAFEAKLDAILDAGASWIALLFDDMRGDFPGLAARQADLAGRIAKDKRARRVILCPTYYSFDPVLDNIFGPRPPGYLRELNQRLPDTIDFFWTGPAVCTQRHDAADLTAACAALGRHPFLWDNSLANDGARRSRFLWLDPKPSFDPGDASLAGAALNPMSQPWLSVHALAGRVTAHSAPGLSEELSALLTHHAGQFAAEGLDGMSATMRQALAETYSTHLPAPYAREIIDWLSGRYAFDLECLTD